MILVEYDETKVLEEVMFASIPVQQANYFFPKQHGSY